MHIETDQSEENVVSNYLIADTSPEYIMFGFFSNIPFSKAFQKLISINNFMIYNNQ